jgi:guanylate kinase
MGLKHYSDFEAVLKNYHASEHAKAVLEQVKLVLLLGPTSSGRNTVIRRIVETGGYYYIVSDTTRPPRTNLGVPEQNGREYWFRTEEEVLADLRAGEFLEAELLHGQQVSGISIRELEKARDARKVALADVDLKGVHNILKTKPDTIVILMVPPSFEEWQRRLSARGQMRPDELRRRFETAQKIFDDALTQNFYHFVVAEHVEQSAALIEAIIQGKANPHQGRAPGLIQHLQSGLRDELMNMQMMH